MYNPFNQGMMYPQFNSYRQPSFQPPAYNQPQFVVKQVTNIEEARVSMIDPLSTYLFVDTSTGHIYLKRLNNNGLSDFFTFKADEPGTNQSNPLDEINRRLVNIETKLGGILNVQSVSGNPDRTVTTESKPDGNAAVAKPESSTVQQSTTDGSWQNRGRNKTDGK